MKAARHSLIPSVYAGLTIKPFGLGNDTCVTYSGPTMIRIRSGKHDSSCAESHVKDFEILLKHDTFKPLCRTDDETETKPVVIVHSDGGPDENPRFQKVIKLAIEHFKTENLNAYFAATNAPGRSAFNR